MDFMKRFFVILAFMAIVYIAIAAGMIGYAIGVPQAPAHVVGVCKIVLSVIVASLAIATLSTIVSKS